MTAAHRSDLRDQLIAKGFIRPGSEVTAGSQVTSARAHTAKPRASATPSQSKPAPCAAAGDFASVIDEFGPDELRVVEYLARRLLEGQRRYGRIDLVADPRDFARERCAEIGDLLIYSAFQALRGGLTP